MSSSEFPSPNVMLLPCAPRASSISAEAIDQWSSIERRLVQRSQNAVERLPFTHRRAFARPRSIGPNPIGSGGKKLTRSAEATLQPCTPISPGLLPTTLMRDGKVIRVASRHASPTLGRFDGYYRSASGTQGQAG